MKTEKKPVSRVKDISPKKKTVTKKKEIVSKKKATTKKSTVSKKGSDPKEKKDSEAKNYNIKSVSKRKPLEMKKVSSSLNKREEKVSPGKPLVVEVIKERKRENKGVFLVIESKKKLRIITFFLILLLSFLVFNSISLIKTNGNIKEYLEIVKKIDEGLNKESINNNEDVADSSIKVVVPGWRSFGDNFSSDAYLNMNKTDMFLDISVTALTFPPVFNLDYINGEDNVVDSSWIMVGTKDSCYSSPSDNCLEVIEDTLVYNNRRIDLPQEMANEKIRRIDSSFLSSIFVLSFSVEEGSEERAYSYTFDGRRYRPLIGKDSKEKIITKYSRGGGVMVAGGSDDDFIILYCGYEGHGYHYKGGELVDISQFFGLRVANGGFYPQIIKQGSGSNSLWYVLSLSEDRPRLIKLWQNETSDIQGASDLSYILKDFSGLKLTAFKEVVGRRGELMFSFSAADNSLSLGLKEPGIYLFKDGGFDNSQERKAFSTNLNYTKSPLTAVAINEVSYSANNDLLDFYFIGSDNNRQKFNFKDELMFSKTNNELYWEAVFKPAKSLEYSPFFDHINSLQFYLTGN